MAWFQKKPAPDGPARVQSSGVPIHELLNEQTILFPGPALDKPRVLEAVVAACCAGHGLGDPSPYLARVREREEGISTTLDMGLALPHARIDGLSKIAAALAVLPRGVCDPKQPDVTVRAMFLFFSPNRQDAFTRHLQVLRGVSTQFGKPGLLEALSALQKPSEVLALLRESQP